MVTFRFVDFGQDLGTRQVGAEARMKLRTLLVGEERVILDFTGVDVVTNSFADECIAKLLVEFPLEELKRRTTFRGLNSMATKSVLGALQRRQSVLTNNF